MDVKEGDKVLYAKYAGTEFKIDGDEYLIVSQKDILAIVADWTSARRSARPRPTPTPWEDTRHWLSN